MAKVKSNEAAMPILDITYRMSQGRLKAGGGLVTILPQAQTGYVWNVWVDPKTGRQLAQQIKANQAE
jgi:hypothetical protein